jgi:putative Holliday junction resolvase
VASVASYTYAYSNQPAGSKMRILAVDPGEKYYGIALSDPTGTVASPLIIIEHISRLLDAAAIIDLAQQHQAEMIVIGQSLDENGSSTPQSRRANRLADVIRQQSTLPVLMWDESFSTLEARQARIVMGTTRKKRRGHLDDLAATVILQSYLDSNLN